MSAPEVAVPSPERRIVLVVNPAAGKGRARFELVRLRHHLIDRGIEAEVFLTEETGHAAKILAGLPLPEGSLVVAVGGDGTVHEVGTSLLDRPGVDLGVVPVGSGNDVAAQLQMPRHPPDALDLLLDGVAIPWDAGTVGPYSFVNTVGFALSAETCFWSHRTGPLTGLARYGLATVRAWWHHQPLRIVLDGTQDAGERWIALLEVGVGDRCGGGFKLTCRADPADGLLDVCLVRAMRKWQMPLLLPRGRTGAHIDHPSVVYEQLASFRLRVDVDTRIHVDGEVRPLARGEHSVRVRPRALRFRVGPDHPLAGRALAPVVAEQNAIDEGEGTAASPEPEDAS